MKTPEVAGSGLFAGLLFHPVIKELAPGNYLVRDFTNGMDSVAELETTGYAYDVGRYNERRRAMYTTELFGELDPWAAKESAAARDIHIGLDIGGPAGTPVHAFAPGAVHSAGYNPAKGDYGHGAKGRSQLLTPYDLLLTCTCARRPARGSHSHRTYAGWPPGVGVARTPQQREHQVQASWNSRGQGRCHRLVW